jgi:hypothetical protein
VPADIEIIPVAINSALIITGSAGILKLEMLSVVLESTIFPDTTCHCLNGKSSLGVAVIVILVPAMA